MAASPTIHEAQAEVLKAISHPIRLLIVQSLSSGEMTVTDIAKVAGAEQSNVSRHLALMKLAGVLASRKAGLKVYYRLNGDEFHQHLRNLLGSISRISSTDGRDRGFTTAPPPSAGGR